MTPDEPDRSEGMGVDFARLSASTDEDLMAVSLRAPEGDFRAFEELITRYEARVRANCRYLTRSAWHADDLAQEVLTKAYFARGTFAGRAAFRTWLWRIKANHCLNHLDKQRVRRVVGSTEDHPYAAAQAADPGPTPDEALERSETRERVRAVVEELPETLRVALILRDLDGLSYADLADTLGIGLSAAKMRVARAREEFRSAYATADPSLSS